MITYQEYFTRRSEGETVKSISESIGKSTKALNRALERVGYVSEGTGNNQRWIWKGEGEEPLQKELLFGREKTSTTVKRHDSISESINDIKSDINNNIDSKSSNNINNKSLHKSKSDSELDYLLQDKKQDKPLYRGFYLSGEAIQVLNNVPSGNRSELVDELIKRFGKDKGLI